MFAVVYSAPVEDPAVLRPRDRDRLRDAVHGGQEFVWGAAVVAGDEITTTSRSGHHERGGMAFYVFESASANQRGERVCRDAGPTSCGV